MSRRVGAVVLAAGGGSRFSGPEHKLLAAFRGRPVVAWAVEAAVGAGLDRTAVVTGAADLAGAAGDEVVVIENEDWADGQATSLAAAIAWADAEGLEAVVVGLGDQPLVRPETWRAVADAVGAVGERVRPIVVATYGGRRGNPVGLDRAVWPLLPTTGDEGARIVMRQRPDLVAELPCDGEAVDIDTWEDLRRWS
ncbi:MAG: nucleotidyltransferase family protein [Acidimicrobiales bacterium]